ncbi:hypothetical protein GXB85_08825 [Cellulomonas sp. APG4]|uniref:hypothetical protein n=1 Tax=Cellulomonas sp. APG4 TaxID=1538656 RepID=UPI00137B6119|nr:hypothetical protein [Cellulomonas sp. APG4]NCT91049.1 hypothetical protein [Cellulomonas sp. APG4]
MTDTPDLASVMADLTASSRPVDRRLLGEVRTGLEQLPDDAGTLAFQPADSRPDLAVRRRHL